MYDLAAYEKRCAEVNAAGKNVMLAVICPTHFKPMQPTGWVSCGCDSGDKVGEGRLTHGVSTWHQPFGLAESE